MELALHHVLDLTDGHIRKHLRVSQARLVSDDWRTVHAQGAESLTQTLGRTVYEAGYEGMLVPSASGSAGTNVVLYPVNLGPQSEVRIRAANQLPGSRTPQDP
jgi:RES domain-containing protein